MSTPLEFRERRAALGLSQRKLARIFGVRGETINRKENGVSKIAPIEWLMLAKLEEEKRVKAQAVTSDKPTAGE